MVRLLGRHGVAAAKARALAAAWLRHADFLLADELPPADYVVGNPPYVRIEQLAPVLQAEYRRRLTSFYDRADLYVAFMERSLKLLSPAGTLSFICADRFTRNRYGAPLGASGVRFKLAQYVQAAARVVPSLASKKVSPHTFRHATAVHLVAAGVDVTVIRSWLGHAHLDTTNHYAQANLDTKREALQRLDPSSKIKQPPPWRRDASVLTWLDSL